MKIGRPSRSARKNKIVKRPDCRVQVIDNRFKFFDMPCFDQWNIFVNLGMTPPRFKLYVVGAADTEKTERRAPWSVFQWAFQLEP